MHADRRAEDSAGHGSPLINIAMAGHWVECGTGGLVGIVFESGALGIGFAETACSRIAGEGGAVLVKPDARTALNIRGENRVGAAQNLHAAGYPLGVELVDGEGSVATLRASGAADKPRAGAARGVSERGIHDLYEFPVARGKCHAGKDIG